MSETIQNPGFIYFATNPSMPGIVKIGCSRHPVTRCQQLSAATGVPSPFDLRFCQFVLDMLQIEQTLHQMLDHCRINRDREFFAIGVEQAVGVLSAWASQLALIPIKGIDFEISEDGIRTLHQNPIPLRRVPVEAALTPAVRFVLWGSSPSRHVMMFGLDAESVSERVALEFNACGGDL